MANIEDILKQHRASLSQAQIDALIAAADAYSRQNAGNRAGALASARQQYDTGYRGLQNMGLAGAYRGAPTSGEVPRLEKQVRTPFDQYNARLHDVERQRVNALGANFAYQNQVAAAQAAAEAEARAKAEAEARARAAAAAVGARGPYNIDRSQTAFIGENGEKSMPDQKAIGLYKATRYDDLSRANAEAAKWKEAVQNDVDADFAARQPAIDAATAAQERGMARTARPQDIAAAAAFSSTNPVMQQQAKERSTQFEQATAASRHAYETADATLRGMEMTRRYGGTVDENKYQAAKRTRDEAKIAYDAATLNRDADTYRAEAQKLQRDDPEYYDAIVTANNPKAAPDAKKRASVVLADRAAKETVSAMGLTKTMTDQEYETQSKNVPDIRRAVNAIDGMTKGMATYDQKRIDEFMDVLKKYGFTSTEEAEKFIRQYDTERNNRVEYQAFNRAYSALYSHQGEKPVGAVNKDEKDYTYRIVNGLKANAPMGTMGDALMSIWRDDKKIIGEDTTKYMTDAQRNAYNAIYEKDGVKAANEYIKEILPLVEMQRAEKDQKWLEQLATEKGFPAWLLARGTNLIGGVPAMVEKLGVGAVNLINEVRTGGSNEILRYSPNSAASRLSNWADIVQSQQAQNILAKHGDGFTGKAINFMYNTGTSMADSLIAMGVGGILGQGASSALFFSSAGNQAYKDAIDRGGTQGQAMGLAILSGTAETIFEEVSLEKLTKTLKFAGKPMVQAVKDALVQAGVEGSEELFTEIANVLSDWAVMKDKSEIRAAINNGELGRFLWDRLSSATLGGLASGLGFGIFGIGGTAFRGAIDSKSKNNLGTKVRERGDVQQVRDTAILIGGEAAQQAEAVQKRETNANVGEMTVAVVQQVQEFGEKLDQDQQVAFARITDGAQMTAEEAADVYKLLGKEIVEEMGYDGSSAEAFQKSYNDRVQSNKVVSKEERMANAEQFRSKKEKQEAAERVWKDPSLGYATTEGGKRVKMPGDLTAVSYEDQKKSNFAARTTAKVGRATYEIAGMKAREGMTDEQKISALKKNMNKAQVARAEFIESLSNALGVDMVIHDDMGLANGYIDNDGKIHFSLSSKQSILRVASHELTHKIREVSEEHFNAIKDAIIKQVGEDTFNERVEQKKQEYKEAGVKLDPDLAIEETVTEYSEKMLQDTDFLEDFVDENPEAAKTLKGELLKILNAVKRAFKRAENRNYGKSFSNEIEYTRDTLQAMYNGLEAVMERAQNQEAKAERQAKREAKQAEAKAAFEEKAKTKQKAEEKAAADLGTIAGDASYYINKLHLSQKSAVQTLMYDGYSQVEAERAVERMAPDWNEQATKKANDLLASFIETSGITAEHLERLLMLNDFTAEQARYGVEHADADLLRKAEEKAGPAKQNAAETDELYMTEESRKAEEVKKAVEESAQKKTYVPGYTAKEVEKVLSVGVFGDRSNYEGNDYENARGMIAQLIPDIVKVLQEDTSVDLFDLNDRMRAAVGEMLKNYFEDDGDMTALREAIPSVIGVDTTAKSDLKTKDQSLFQMSAKLSKALGKKVTLVSETNAKGQRNASYKSAEKLEELWERVRDQFGLSDEQDFSVDLPRLLEFIEKQSDTRRKASDLFNVQEAIDETTVNLLDAVKEMLQEKTGKKYSLDTDVLRFNDSNPGYRYSIDADSKGRDLSPQQQEYFKDSSVRDDNGKLLVLYHGTTHFGEITKFRKGKSGWLGPGIYLTSRKADAQRYANAMGEGNGTVYELYANAKNPLVVSSADPAQDILRAIYGTDTVFQRRSANQGNATSILTAADIKKLKSKGYDGIRWNYANSTEVSVFSPEQVKRTDNTSPTVSKDIRYSIDADYMRLAEKYRDGSISPSDMIKMRRDVNEMARLSGYTELLYHGTDDFGFTAIDTSASEDHISFFATDSIPLVRSYAMNKQVRDVSTRSIDGRIESGIYQLYANTEDFLEIDAGGAEWNAIPVPESLREDIKRVLDELNSAYGTEYAFNGKTISTKALAAYAKESYYRGVKVTNVVDYGTHSDGKSRIPGTVYSFLYPEQQVKSADLVTVDSDNDIIPLSDRFDPRLPDIRYSIDTDAIRQVHQAFTAFDAKSVSEAMTALQKLKNVNIWALKDISRMLDAVAGGDTQLRDTLHKVIEEPHSTALKHYAEGVKSMQTKVLAIGAKAGVCDMNGKHFDKKKSAAIQNIGEGFCNRKTDISATIAESDKVSVRAVDTKTRKDLGKKTYTQDELRKAYGKENGDYIWSAAHINADAGANIQVNTQPYTLADLKEAYPDDWQKLKTAADEFRQMYDGYIRDMNNMLETIYPYANRYANLDSMEKAIQTREDRLARHKMEAERRVEKYKKQLEEAERGLANKQKKAYAAKKLKEMNQELTRLEKEIQNKKRTDTKAYAELVDKANALRDRINKVEAETEKTLRKRAASLQDRIAETKAEIAEYEANINEELDVMRAQLPELLKAAESGESLNRMHRLEFRSDYFHHFQEMASGLSGLRSILTSNTDISPAIVGRSENTKSKSRWAGFFQERKGADYTADALNGMLRYGQLSQYKLAFDPLVAYMRDVTKQVRNIDDNTNRNSLVSYLDEWTNIVAGKSSKIDRAIMESGLIPRRAQALLNFVNSRVIQNTLLFNMRSSLIQISNITNAKGMITNNRDWLSGIRCWAAASKGNNEMANIMSQSSFLASRYMDNIELTDSVIKNAKQFGGWMLGALDEVSAKLTWWAAYNQYVRDPKSAMKYANRSYENAIDYADDITRRTHAGRGVGELAPIMNSKVVSFIAPFQVEVNNTYQQLKDQVKKKNFRGLMATSLSVFLFNTIFEALVGSTPLQFDWIRAVMDIVLGIKDDDPDDDKDDYTAWNAAQRMFGEFAGNLPYATQLVNILGQDTAKKVLGEDNEATRYGNTQIGVKSVTNAVGGVVDITKNLVQGKNVSQINWLSDIEDLLNLTLPFGGKQLTRSIRGVYTVAQGYGSKNNKEGDEQVQFATESNLLHYIHAGLFGKWALPEASQFFGDKRAVAVMNDMIFNGENETANTLFGTYVGPKSSIGTAVPAKEYKAALQTGIDGKQYFTLKYDLAKYKTQGGKRAEMMEQSFTPEQKAKLDALLFADKDDVMKTDGALVYKQGSDGEWNLKVDYTDQDMFDLSMLGAKVYDTTKGLIKGGFKKEGALTAAHAWDDLKDTPDKIEGVDDRKLAFRNMLMASTAYTPEQKAQLDKAFCNTKTVADYTSKELFDISIKYSSDVYDKAKEAEAVGIKPEKFVQIYDKWKGMSGKDKKDQARKYLKSLNLSKKEYEYFWKTVFKYKEE